MDPLVPPPFDIYQIHRTPFFKRLHRNDSDQFERLKKAYESIRSFDEKPLQIQVNKIRIEKLVQRIKDSLPIANSSTAKKQRPRPKSKHQIRCEELAKARQLGNQYLREKYNSTPRLNKQKKFASQEECVMKNSKLNLRRRLDYGNQKSELNRSKIQRTTEAIYLTDDKEFSTFSRTPKSATREKLRKFLLHYLSEDNPDPDVVSSFEEIAKTKNHLYWDLMEAIKKQQQFIKRYDKFTKKLSKFAMKNAHQQNQPYHLEVFKSKTNIRPPGSEILIKTYRYSDEDQYLPPPSESLLRIPPDLPDDVTNEIPTRDDVNEPMDEIEESDSSTQLHITLPLPNLTSTTNTRIFAEKLPQKKFDLTQKFGEVIRKTVRKESAIMLANLEKAMRH